MLNDNYWKLTHACTTSLSRIVGFWCCASCEVQVPTGTYRFRGRYCVSKNVALPGHASCVECHPSNSNEFALLLNCISQCCVTDFAKLTQYLEKRLTSCTLSTVEHPSDGLLRLPGHRYLIKLLLLRGYAFNASADFETVRMMKEKLCYVGYDIDIEQKLANETTVLVEEYTLPDGRTIKVCTCVADLYPKQRSWLFV